MFNTLAHYLVGAATGAIARRFPTLACILAAGFFLYQSIEMYRKNQLNEESKDNAYPEIRQFLVGFGVGAAAEAADAAVMRGGVGDRLRRWRDRWVRAVGEIVGAPQPAEHRVGAGAGPHTTLDIKPYQHIGKPIYVNGEPIAIEPAPATYTRNSFFARLIQSGVHIPIDPILRRETPDGRTELLGDQFRVEPGYRFHLLDPADNA